MSEVTAATDQPQPSRKAALQGAAIWMLASLIGRSLRMRREGNNIAAIIREHQGAILVTWHGRTLLGANEFRKMGFWALISLSRDGEVQNHIFQRFGFRTIRGSTGRGGAKAALQLARKVKQGEVLAFTPDGPRGPTHRVQPGTILLAQKSGKPIVPFGTSAWPRKLLPSWDSYLIPWPLGRGALVLGDPIYVAQDLTEEQKAEVAATVERAIDRCESRADELAGVPTRSGVREHPTVDAIDGKD